MLARGLVNGLTVASLQDVPAWGSTEVIYSTDSGSKFKWVCLFLGCRDSYGCQAVCHRLYRSDIVIGRQYP